MVEVVGIEEFVGPGREGLVVGMMDEEEEFVVPVIEEVKPDVIIVDEFEKRGIAEEPAELAGGIEMELALPKSVGKISAEVIG